ncbi:hypothetical protein CI1B_28220 [Bradyrhizobium ivorense]|uniref:Uncharacterized protein n=1 Tax=Bradyrhizobium ivorense TaxID=2511166 RepID=A0A508T2V4_9BRAD|nr:hypothetical protein [Bradyrhizobium ivorense]VIO69615.1 hypothetical protein CI1B_28220 [Bradyrhizobium ivorense]
MSTSHDEQIDRLVQERWRAIGLSQRDVAEVLGTTPAKVGAGGAARIDDRRLTALARMLGPSTELPADVTPSLQSLLELRMLRVFREVQSSDTKRILIELAAQIVRRQVTPPEAG